MRVRQQVNARESSHPRSFRNALCITGEPGGDGCRAVTEAEQERGARGWQECWWTHACGQRTQPALRAVQAGSRRLLLTVTAHRSTVLGTGTVLC